MKLYKSVAFKLFVLLFLILTSFLSIVIYIQVYFIQRSYSIPDYTVERLRQIEPQLLNLADYELGSYQSGYLETMYMFEVRYSVNLLLLDKSLDKVWMTKRTQAILDKAKIDFIKKKIKEFNESVHYYPYPGDKQPIFHILDKYNLPTEYIALVTSCGQTLYSISKENGDTQVWSSSNTNQSDMKYVVTVVPTVFTSHSSGLIKGYMAYILLVLLLVILIVSAILSYLVTRPIMKINKTAADIAALDFSKKCEVKNDNEIGNLARTINSMSDNLQNALGELNSANCQLKKDLDIQKELDLMRRDFLAAVTHEFKTPITLIKGYTESIVDGVAEGNDKETALETIVRETEKLDRFVNDILELSRLESVGYRLNISEFYVKELLCEICDEYRNAIKDRNISLINNFSDSDILANGDRFRIGQVLTNFLNNAIDHTPSGMSILLTSEAKDGKAVISIHNQGKCIEPAELDRIWEKFYRVEKSRNKKFGGAGLGLAISKSILSLHNSSFGVYNTEDGVTFYFTLELYCINQ